MPSAHYQRRLLRRTPRTPIGAAPRSGVVKVVGQVEYRRPAVRTPITGTLCAYYELVIDEWCNGVSCTVVRQRSEAPVCIGDDTGYAQVAVDDATVLLGARERLRFGLVREAPYAIAGILARCGRSAVDETGLLEGITFHERTLVAGDRVAVFGRTEWAIDDAEPTLTRAGYRELPRQLIIRPGRDHRALMSDDRKAVAAWPGLVLVQSSLAAGYDGRSMRSRSRSSALWRKGRPLSGVGSVTRPYI